MGAYVELDGTLLPDGHVQVIQMQLRLFNLQGHLQQASASAWLVDGVRVEIAPQTQILGQPQAGQRVDLTAIRLSEGQFLALSVVLGNAPTPTRASATLVPLPGETPAPALMITPPPATTEPDETAEPQETDEPDDSDTADDDDDAVETETVEPAETEETDKTEAPGG